MTSRAGLSNILEDLKCKSLDWTLEAVENDMDQTVHFSKLYPAATLRVKLEKERKFSR